MSGNVWKWCLTEYRNNNINLLGNESRILRGGSWGRNSDGARASYRYINSPDDGYDFFGFFVVCRP